MVLIVEPDALLGLALRQSGLDTGQGGFHSECLLEIGNRLNALSQLHSG